MNDFDERHVPTAEFHAALDREIARALRNETQFEPVEKAGHARRFGVALGMTGAALLMLSIGLVIGASTSYASAEVLGTTQPRPALALLKEIPMKNALTALTCAAVALGPQSAPAQQKGIPVVTLPAATARTTESFGAILGLVHGADGKVLVNDAAHRQVKLFDSTLTTSTTVIDSVPGTSHSYGARPMPLSRYLGDSALFGDWNSRSLLVLDPHGKVAHALSLPNPSNFGSILNGFAGVDMQGRLVFRHGRPPNRNPGQGEVTFPDTILILRADLDQRKVDTVGSIRRPLMRVVTQKSSDGRVWTLFAPDPLQAVDDWAMLSNGSLAFVRGHDYHIDWIHQDGTAGTTGKIPFDWKRLEDADKEKLSDSLRKAQDSLLASGYMGAEASVRKGGVCEPAPLGRVESSGAGSGRAGGAGGAPPAGECTQMSMNGLNTQLRQLPGALQLAPRGPFPPLADLLRGGPIADYLSPIRANATLADRDGNLWVLPHMSSLSQQGELVYDVIDAKGELLQRVRLPAGRAIAGFGKGGIVYMTSGDRANGFYLERSKLPSR